MQTIARANRVAEGKSNGLIIDYIKKVAVDLLDKIKAKISELDHWTDKQETKAEVDTLIGKILWEELPESYSDSAIFEYRKLIFEYVFMRYKQVA